MKSSPEEKKKTKKKQDCTAIILFNKSQGRLFFMYDSYNHAWEHQPVTWEAMQIAKALNVDGKSHPDK